MRLLIFSIFFYIQIQALGQIHNSNISLLYSKGNPPEFLTEYVSRFYIPQNNLWIKGIKNDKKKFYLDQVYASKMVVYGDPISQYCTELIKEITPNPYSVFLVRSDAVATFSDSSNIFITSGLISRLSNEAQLMFFLSREIEVIKGSYKPIFEKPESKVSLNNTISELSTYSKEIDIELDKKSYDLIKNQGLYTNEELTSAFDVLKFQNRPFYEYSFDIKYFNSEHSYIPKSKFFLIHKPNPEFYSFEKEFPQLTNRINNFESSTEPPTNFTFLKNKKEFVQIVNISRHESVGINILKADFLGAIYGVYLLEKLGHNSPLLDKLKASAWWGFINQHAGNIQLKNYTPYEISDSKGAVFMRFLRMQTKPAKIALGLRILKDIKTQYPESKAISRMYDDIISIAAESKEFELDSFYKTDLLTSIEQFHLNDSIQSNKDLLDTDTQLTNAKGVDSVNYHYFLIPDLMKSSSFIEKYNSFKNPKKRDTKKSPTSVSITEFSLVNYKKNKIKQIDDSNEIIDGAYEIANSKTDIQVSKFTSADQYNLNYLINSVYIQNYHYNNYKKTLHSPLSDEISKLLSTCKSDVVGVCIFEQAFEPKYRPFHLLGLLGITLPYVIPEFFFSGNKTIYSSIYFNVINGTIERLIYDRFNDPFKKRIIQDSFLKSLLITFPEHD